MRKGIIVHPDEFGKKQIDRAAELGIDLIGIHPIGGKDAADSLGALVELCKNEHISDTSRKIMPSTNILCVGLLPGRLSLAARSILVSSI